jgi:FAD/FMN-containing dehydrogenase
MPSDIPILRRGEDRYEDARRAAIWNGKKPDRFPAAVVVARDVDDVVAAVRLAGEEGWTIGIRSGGHAWSANAVRDGGLLLDLSRLDDCEVDPEARTATAGPGMRSQAFQKQVAAHGL